MFPLYYYKYKIENTIFLLKYNFVLVFNVGQNTSTEIHNKDQKNDSDIESIDSFCDEKKTEITECKNRSFTPLEIYTLEDLK